MDTSKGQNLKAANVQQAVQRLGKCLTGPTRLLARPRKGCSGRFLASRGTIRGRRFSAGGFRRSAFNSRHKGPLDAVETAPAQDRGNDSTRSLSVTKAYVTAAHVAVDSHFRDERD